MLVTLVIYNHDTSKVFVHQSTLVDEGDWDRSKNSRTVLGKLKTDLDNEDMRGLIPILYEKATTPSELVKLNAAFLDPYQY